MMEEIIFFGLFGLAWPCRVISVEPFGLYRTLNSWKQACVFGLFYTRW